MDWSIAFRLVAAVVLVLFVLVGVSCLVISGRESEFERRRMG